VATYNLPPNTRAVGTVNPGPDMDAVVDVLNHSVYQRVFYLDQYGADPTGVATSDAAWTACYTDAAAALQTNAGAMIVLGCGQYRFSVNTVSVTDYRIGLRGQGKPATTIYTTGNTGTLVNVTGAGGGSQGSAPVTGFNLYGWSAGAGVVGMRYGDRLNGTMTDVSASGFTGTGGKGFWFQDTTGNNSEGSVFALASDNNTVCYDFDAVTPASGASVDYSDIYLHLGLTTTTTGVNAVGVRFQNGMHCYGSRLQISGNVRSVSPLVATVLQVGNSVTDTSHISRTNLHVSVEADSGTGTINDVLIQGVDSSKGIGVCYGEFIIPGFGGTVTAGSITSPAVCTMWGNFNAPIFTSHGTKTDLGTAAAGLSTYSG
jgi:hypothetical protein